MTNVLVVCAHPDDEVLGCGATIARLAKEGHEIHIAILGQGITSRFRRQDQPAQPFVEKLHICSRRVANMLGASDICFYNLPDNRFDTIALLDIVKIVEDIIERVQPHVIYTHHGGDLNIDHVLVHRAVLTATRPMGKCSVKEINAFEIPSSTEWAFGQFQPGFCPNVFMDITATLNIKIEALRLYESEIRDFPHPRSAESVTALARYRGSTVGLEAGEAFELIRTIK